MTAASLTAESLAHAYGAAPPTLKGISFTIEPGEFFTLLGPSGCGKTTTLRLVAGLLSPTAGRILIGTRDITAVPTHERDISVVFQNYALFPHMTVADNVGYGLKIRGKPRREIAAAVEEALATVGLPGMDKRYPTELSGGQQQRVGLARAIAVKPRVMLLDEPLSNLDAKLREQMCLEIAALQRRMAMTVLYVTHDQAEALAISDRIAVMSGGEIREIGTPTEIYRRPRSLTAATFLGDTNLVRLRVGRDGVTLPSGKALAMATNPVAVGGEVTVAIRPEAIDFVGLDPAGALPSNHFRALIESRVYRGATSQIVLKAEDFPQPVQALVLGEAGGQPGETVVFRIDPNEVHQVAGAAS
ncbi:MULTISPECIES: ABC transporter ATP-binding protein [unclassified Chelatococcus]|uniref:ABC transporter ATP-binding protein n=1 Tax=unclassified Chelatococcus TaxID=2638111 RepID=UPI001BCBDE83|nr:MULTISPECIES: ABC transporter ATP-binding protein [unclassified Chelatococcus]CAH1652443.1 Fe(3+) ions import ATP-binding protein FbpC 1 [Hyphomicrobiales bacterium]MBS7739985.1 ABC transporter ATP-binding protein [Chelatococcus sp. HY11]MBX3547006.1 ABC transporter ATP-binding protein [Chelatococcus sp.]MCO5078715.1 ABC transporter ATP-binding protein [Chelatococcus sp.]CAH1685990.1 Fe(3+) ions import ATP-binding protein FbpC 1 [Hyphomicrobiales bacterium]